MTRKDYILLAAALKSAQPPGMQGEAVQHMVDCKRIADALATTNPRFDRLRFLKACGLDYGA